MKKRDFAIITFILIFCLLVTLTTFFYVVDMAKDFEEWQKKQAETEIVENSVETVENIETAIRNVIEQPKYTEMKVTATAYCPCEKCCGIYAKNRPIDKNGERIILTASGARAKVGKTISVDKSVIPFGTEVIIDGKTYIAEDTGRAIKGNKIDIYFDNHDEALNFGRKTITVLIKNADV